MQRLLTLLFTPLFLAVAKKKKPAKPVRRKPAKAARAASKPAKAKKLKPKTKPATSETRATKKGKLIQTPVQPTAVAKAEATEPAPKPRAPTGRAILIAPENDKFTDSLHPTFRWLSVGGANRYEVAWSESADLAHPLTLISIATEATVPVEKPLRVGTTYFWRVRGGNEGGWGPWSSTASFHVLESNA
jgi:hypothetical protein